MCVGTKSPVYLSISCEENQPIFTSCKITFSKWKGLDFEGVIL